MIHTVDTNNVLAKTLQTYVCDTVWNMPLTECRRNIILRAISRGHAKVNTVDLGHVSVDLPYHSALLNKKAFYVYAVDKHCMGGLIVDINWSIFRRQLEELHLSNQEIKNARDKYLDGWYPLSEYLNYRPFDLRIHGFEGKCLYRADIYIRNHPYQDMFLIAVESSMAKTILGNDYDFYKLGMSVYYDSDYNLATLKKNTPIIQCFHPNPTDIAAINKAFTAYTNFSTESIPGLTVSPREQTICFINGCEAEPSSLDDISGGEYIEIVHDPDIICNIVMNLQDTTQNNIYRSPTDSTYKYIVHIPKQANPENHIITHNTCDMFVRPVKNGPIENARLKGRFVHRFNTSVKEDITTRKWIDFMITQITHNDFGISEKLLQPYIADMKTSEIEIRVVIRRHAKTHKLDLDSNFLQILYSFDDQTIIKFLTGNSKDDSLTFWKADQLEISPYAKMLMDVPSTLNHTTIDKLIHTLGYYNTLSVITPRVTRSIKYDTKKHIFNVDIPVSMLACKRIYPLVYINGLKIDQDLITYKRQYQHLNITLSDTVAYNDGDELEVELLDFPVSGIKLINPSKNNISTPIFPYGIDVDFYEVTIEKPTTDYLINLSKKTLRNCGRSFTKIDDLSSTFLTNSNTNDPEYVYKWKADTGDCLYTNTSTPLSLTKAYTSMDLKGTELTVALSAANIQDNEYIFTNGIIKRKVNDTLTSYYPDGVCGTYYTFKNQCIGRTYAAITKSTLFRLSEIVHTEQTDNGTISFKIGGTTTPENTTTSDILYRLPDYNLQISDNENPILKPNYTTMQNIPLPIVNPEWTELVFLNGKELVKDVDYMITPVKGVHGIQNSIITICNLSYLKLGDNNLEIYITSDKKFMDFNGFMHVRYDKSGKIPKYLNGVIEELNPMVYWIDRLCTLAIDGVHRTDVYREDGYLKVSKMNELICRQGGLYTTRGMIPREARLFVDQYITEDEDTTKLTAIINYLKEHAIKLKPELEVIPFSHHIVSITMAALVKDVLMGTKRLNYDEEYAGMLSQIPEYLELRKYDAAQNGVATELTITDAGVAKVNTTYTIFDASMTGLNRKWINKPNRLVLWWNCAARAHRWEIKSMLAVDQTVYYYANDKDGSHDPWKLTWKAVNKKFSPTPLISSGALDLAYIDLFPSYSSDLHTVLEDRALRQAIKALFPVDTIRDGDTTI